MLNYLKLKTEECLPSYHVIKIANISFGVHVCKASARGCGLGNTHARCGGGRKQPCYKHNSWFEVLFLHIACATPNERAKLNKQTMSHINHTHITRANIPIHTNLLSYTSLTLAWATFFNLIRAKFKHCFSQTCLQLVTTAFQYHACKDNIILNKSVALIYVCM